MAAPSPAKRQTPRKQASRPKPVPLHAVPREEPIGRFAELRAEVIQEPYPITATLSIDPPNKARMAKVVGCQASYLVARRQLQAITSPLLDERGEILRDDDGQPIMPKVSVESLQEIQRVVDKAGDEYDRALFGDRYDAVMAYFANEQAAVWNAFYKDVQDTFLPTPPDGKCPACGRMADEDQAGKPVASSTSSSTTGTP